MLKKSLQLILNIILLIGTPVFLYYLFAFWYASQVVDKAAKIAKYQAYCIQVSNSMGEKTDYLTANSFLDFFPFTMKAKLGERHAIVIVSQTNSKFYYWSYWKNEFIPDDWYDGKDRTLAIYCQPKQNFVDKLLKLSSKLNNKINQQDIYVKFNNQVFLIPNKYNPKVRGDYSPEIELNFSPYSTGIGKRLSELGVTIVEIGIGEEEANFMKKWISRTIKDTWIKSIKQLKDEYGIKKQLINSEEIQYYTLDKNNEFTTSIQCSSVTDYNKVASCQHRFIYKNLHFHFSHKTVADWKQIQEYIKNIVDSITVDSNSK